MEVGEDRDENEDKEQKENMSNRTHCFTPEILTRTVVSMVIKDLLPSSLCCLCRFGLSRR